MPPSPGGEGRGEGGAIVQSHSASIRPEPFAEAGDGLLCRSVAVGQGENLSGGVAVEADATERLRDGREVRVAQPDRLPVAVGEVDMAEIRTSKSERVRDGNLFD